MEGRGETYDLYFSYFSLSFSLLIHTYIYCKLGGGRGVLSGFKEGGGGVVQHFIGGGIVICSLKKKKHALFIYLFFLVFFLPTSDLIAIIDSHRPLNIILIYVDRTF